MSSHGLHDGFEVLLRWEDGGIGPGAAGLLWSEGVLAEVIVFVVVGPTLLRGLGQPARPPWLPAQGSCAGASPLSPRGSGYGARGTGDGALHSPCCIWPACRCCLWSAPPAFAATAQGIYGGVAVGTFDRHHDTGVRTTLRRSRSARVLGHGAALCGCVANRVRDAPDLHQCIRSNPIQPAPR